MSIVMPAESNSARIWFTSDTHFGHARIIDYCKRPFSSVHHMNDVMIQNWNACVQPDDDVFHLGDYLWSMPLEALQRLRARLNGRIHLIPGNHDYGERLLEHGIVDSLLPAIHELEVSRAQARERMLLVLCHFPLEEWNRFHRGSVHLHGHCHGRLPSRGLRRFDVGVDAHHFRPVSLAEIIRMFADGKARS